MDFFNSSAENKIHPDAETPLVSDDTKELLRTNAGVNVVANAQQKDLSAMIDRVVDHLDPILVSNDIYAVKTIPELIEIDKSGLVFDKAMAASSENDTIKNVAFTLKLRSTNGSHEEDRFECAVVSPSSLDEHTDETFKQNYFKKISNGDPEIESTLKSFYDYHELKHCLTAAIKHGPLYDDVINSFKDFASRNPDIAADFEGSQNSPTQSGEYDNFQQVTLALVDESLSDVFSALKTQQEYFLKNKKDILSGDKPLVNPVLSKISALRSEYAYIDVKHNTSIPLNNLLTSLSSYENNEKLLKASDIELNATSYKIIDECFPGMVAQVGHDLFLGSKESFSKGVNIEFDKSYEQYFEHGKPIFGKDEQQKINFPLNAEHIGKIIKNDDQSSEHPVEPQCF